MPNHRGHDLAAEAECDRITAEVQIECELEVSVDAESEALAERLLAGLAGVGDVDVEYSMFSIDLNPDGWEYVPPDEPPEPDP